MPNYKMPNYKMPNYKMPNYKMPIAKCRITKKYGKVIFKVQLDSVSNFESKAQIFCYFFAKNIFFSNNKIRPENDS
jgi:hypothetical protein